jgi:peroxiredoxin
LPFLALAVLAAGCQDSPSVAAVPASSAPELEGISAWVNSEPLTLKDLRGKVVILHFWTNGCVNCVHNYPAYKTWHAEFAGKGAVVFGVHTPEFDAEKDLDRLRERIKKHGLAFPVAVDNDGATWRAWHNQYWPAIYLIDRGGRIRYRWEGELGNDGEAGVRRKIVALLAEEDGPVKEKGR